MMEIPNVQNMSGSEACPEKYLGPAVLVLVLLFGAILRIWLSINDDGIYWPDEIYQSLEPAHRLVFGYGFLGWEFVDGARSYVFPGLIAIILKFSSVLGLDDPARYLIVVRLIFSGVSVATAYGSYRLARAFGSGILAAACGASVVALGAPFIFFSPRAMSESASALPLIFGAAIALRTDAGRKERILGVLLVGFSAILRMHNGIFCAGLLCIWAWRRQWRTMFDVLAALLFCGFLYGLIDRLTWGGWFHSAIHYLRFNMIEGKSSQWGTSPVLFYCEALWRSLGFPAIIVAIFSIFSIRRASGLLLITFSFIFIHSLIPHKEFRFILPALPIACALAAIGMDEMFRRFSLRKGAWCAASAAFLLSAASGARFHGLTNGDLTASDEKLISTKSAYDRNGPTNRLLIAAHKQKDLCGLKIETAHIDWTGGFGYLHRDVPLYARSMPLPRPSFYNYSIDLAENLEDGEEIVAEDGRYALIRRFHGGCERDRDFEALIPR